MPVQPSQQEEEYFARMEMERRKKHQEERLKTLAAEEKSRLKDLHYMRCPKCGMELKEIPHKGVNIDKCFSCDGIWLDAGELEILAKLEKAAFDKLFSVFRK
jgi:protein-arginine kinase activator protein McsA